MAIAGIRADLDVDRFFKSEPRAPVRRWRTFGPLLLTAAAVALTMFLLQPWPQGSTPATEIATGPGEQRTVQLADGSSVALNGNSRIQISGERVREAQLISGEALFHVRHRADRAFFVSVGDDRIQDLGTIFNVIRDGDAIGVEVAEGAIRYSRGDSGLQLRAGQTLEVLAGGDALVGHKPSSAIGSWAAGQLVYQGVAVAEVAKDLGRNLGVRVSVTPELALQQFTGAISTRGPPEKVVGDFSSTIAAHARKTGDGWLIR